MLLAALLVPWASKAQVTCPTGNVVTVSNADTSTTTTSYFPGYATYNYSYTEVIIPAEQLSGIGTIRAFMYKPTNTTSSSYYTNCEIYLGHTTATDLSAGFIQDAASFELVWEGDMSWTNIGWQTIEFDEPFDYDGSSNIVVAVRRGHGSWSSSSSFAAFTASAPLARYIYQDSGPYTIGSISGGYTSTTVGWYKLLGCEPVPVSCNRVRGLHADSIFHDEVYLSWTDTLNSGATYSIYDMSDTSLIASNLTTTSYTVTGLVGNTPYQFGVEVDCGAGDYSEIAKINVRTACVPVNYVLQDFEDGIDQCWTTAYVGGSGNYPYITSYNDGHVLYTYGYKSGSSYNYFSLIASPQMIDSLNLYEVEFDMKASSTSSTYSHRVMLGVMTDPTDYATFDTIAVFDAIPNTSTWTSQHVSLADYHGDAQYIAWATPAVFQGSNTYAYNYVHLDNLYVGRISSCPKPGRFHARDITGDGATLAWDENTDFNGVVVKWGTINNEAAAIDSIEVNGVNSVVLTGLNPSTTYYCWAHAVCSDEDSRVVATTFSTLDTCQAPVDLTVVSVSYNAAAITWADHPVLPSESYTFMWKADTADNWNSVTTTNNYYFLEGLTEGTTYSVQVSPSCSNNVYSSVSFTTMLYGTVGPDEGSFSYLPFYPFYKYSISEQLWTADELSTYGDTIYGIRFNSYGTNSGRVVKMYIGNTSMSDLSTSSFITTSDMTLVYYDTMDVVVGWNDFTFSTPFVRDLNSNLVLYVTDSTGSYTSFAGWHAYNSSITSLYDYQDGSPFSSTDLADANEASVRAVMQLIAPIAPRTCTAPVPAVVAASSDAITVAWAPGQDETTWTVSSRVYGDTVWTLQTASCTDTFYTFAGLDAATHYEFRIGSVCTDNTLYATADGYTACDDFSTPYVETFNAMSSNNYVMNPCWTKGSFAGDTPYTVNITGQGMSMLMPVGSYVIFPQFTDPLNEMQIRFQYAVADTSIYALVGICEHPNDILSMTVVDTVWASANGVSEWHTTTFDTYEGTNGYIAIYSSYNQTYYDNINIELMPMCKAPTAVTITTTTTTADISWDTPLNATGYRVEYGVMGSGVTSVLDGISGTSVTLSGLQHSTTYQVTIRTACSGLNDSSIASNVFVFTTDCDVVTLPYTQNFDNCNAPALTYTGILPNCWNRVMLGSSPYDAGNYLAQIYNSSTYASSGQYCLMLYGKAVVTLPEMPVSVDSLMLSFHHYCGSVGYYGLEIGVCDSNWGRFEDSFVPIDTIIATDYVNDHVLYNLATYAGTGRYIAFRNFYVTSSSIEYSTHYIDDVVVDLLPSCLPVMDVHSSAMTTSSLSIDWTDLRPSTDWEIAYSTSALSDPSTGTVIPVSTHPYDITGLADSDYYFYVRNVCSATDKSIWSSVYVGHPGYYNMRANASDTVNLCGAHLFDDGGIDGNYSASQNSTLVLMPDSSYVVVLNGTTYTESSFDYLRIYDGIGTSGTELWNDYGSSSTNIIDNVASTTGPLTLVFHSDGSVQYSGFAIDVTCVSNACPITDIDYNPAVNPTSSTLPIVWVGSSSSYEIEYGFSGFERGTGTTVTSTTNSVTLTGLSAATTYDVYIRGYCDPDTSRWFKASFVTSLCDFYTMGQNFDDADSVVDASSYMPLGTSFYNYGFTQTIIPASRLAGIAGEINAMAFNSVDGNKGEYYTNMTVYLANVTENDLEAGFILPSDTGYIFTKVIDSVDFTYDDGGWHAHGFTTPFTWNGTSNILVTIKRDHGSYSSGASFVSHSDTVARGRYAYRDSDPYTFADAATVTSYSTTTVGDIRLIACGAGCLAPANITADTSSYNSLTFTWADSDTTEVVLVQGLWNGDEGLATQMVYTNNVTFNGLTPSTQYTFAARQVCDGENYSEWSIMTVYTAELPCFAPGTPEVSGVGYEEATITWSAGGIETAWAVRVYNTTFDRTDTVTAMTYTATGLTSGVTYNVTVSSLCGTNHELASEPSDTVNFTTAICTVPTGVDASDITATQATITWTSTGALSYEIEYGDRGFLQGEGTLISNITGTQTVLTGLEPEMMYDVYVRGYCTATLVSAWSDQKSFTTPQDQGIDDVNGSMVNLYPNPASQQVTVSGFEGQATVSVVDMNGREVYTATANGSLTIDVSGMAKGAYFVRITGESSSAIRKLIVK